MNKSDWFDQTTHQQQNEINTASVSRSVVMLLFMCWVLVRSDSGVGQPATEGEEAWILPDVN